MSVQRSVALEARAPPPPAIQFYTIELMPNADGRVFIAITATICEHEGELENMDMGCQRVGTIDDALAAIREAFVATLPN